MAKALTLFWLLAMGFSQAGYEAKLSIVQLLAQSDVVVVGKLKGVKEWIADGVAHREGVIEISDALEGKIPESEKATLRWANELYRSGALELSDTGDAEFIWLLWRAQDGTYRARHSGCQIPLSERATVLAAIQKRRAEQGSAGQPATRSESDSEGGDKPQPESEWRSR